MELDLMFTGSEDILSRCCQPRHEVMKFVSPIVGKRDYGTTIKFLGVNIVFQDMGMIELGVRVFRTKKEIDVDVELGREWVKNAKDADIKLALLQCLIKAVGIAKQHLTRKDDDFDTDKLTADLESVLDKL